MIEVYYAIEHQADNRTWVKVKEFDTKPEGQKYIQFLGENASRLNRYRLVKMTKEVVD